MINKTAYTKAIVLLRPGILLPPSPSQIIEHSKVLVTQRKKTKFFTVGLAQDLNRLLLFIDGQQHNSLALPEINLITACSSLAAHINPYPANVEKMVSSE
jgi:hypothetical protein